MKMLLVAITAVVVLSAEAGEIGKPQAAVARTEIRVAKNLNPDEMQTLNVMTRDGNVAQLIVKRRDANPNSVRQREMHQRKTNLSIRVEQRPADVFEIRKLWDGEEYALNEKPTRNNFGKCVMQNYAVDELRRSTCAYGLDGFSHVLSNSGV
ncbi:hypothetical protein FQA39_LY19114 [Lamprigera yunnana]|nr:hypothetical protein FQA39_LY19114 [Lamprigera yunnana]